ncbi:hypothetical protein HMI55_007035 [Coelomomyces lativittatus]|nr:hypothetical protein HMI55_007035 [Coelomomyces lativittatus]
MTSSTPLFSNAIKELRIHLCQTSPASVGLRAFILEQYQSLKKDHPNLPMLIRECQGTEARVFARYG